MEANRPDAVEQIEEQASLSHPREGHRHTETLTGKASGGDHFCCGIFLIDFVLFIDLMDIGMQNTR
jgi:hypothetical protein